MTVLAGSLKFYLSGGSSNNNPNASLGGVRSSVQVVAAINNLFDDVTSGEATSGATEYRCLYFRNEDADATGLINPKAWFTSQTPSADTVLAMGIDPAGKNGVATTIANEITAPAGVTFTEPASKAAGLSLPGAPYVQNDFVAIWVRRTVTAGAASASSDPGTVRVEGDTN